MFFRLIIVFSFLMMILVTDRLTIQANAGVIIDVDSSFYSADNGGGDLADATYDLLYTSSSLFGNGSSVLFVDGTNGAYADATIDILFSLSADHVYTLAVTLDAFQDLGIAFADFSLTGPTVSIQLVNDEPNFVTQGILTAGSYHLIAHSRVDQNATSGQAGSQFGFSLEVSESIVAAPEPTTFACLGVCLILGLSTHLTRSLGRRLGLLRC